MKHLLLLAFACCILPCGSHAADPIVIVTSATSVTVDGTDYGKPADTIADNKQLSPLIQNALEKYAAQIEADKAAAVAEHAALKARIDSTLNGMLNDELKTGEGPRTTLLRKLIAEAGKSDNELKLEAAKAAEAAAIAARKAAEAEVAK